MPRSRGSSTCSRICAPRPTIALNNATLPFALALADKGWRRALSDNPHLQAGLNVCAGKITHPAVAQDLGFPAATFAEVSA